VIVECVVVGLAIVEVILLLIILRIRKDIKDLKRKGEGNENKSGLTAEEKEEIINRIKSHDENLKQLSDQLNQLSNQYIELETEISKLKIRVK